MVGLLTSALAFFSIWAAGKAIRAGNKNWERFTDKQPERLPGLIGGGNLKIARLGILLSVWVPLFFICLWLLAMYVMIHVFHLNHLIFSLSVSGYTP
ncbi:MAG TPA: hypothetical protein VJU59_33515 [Paraburkholderia sp.]|uniref:hypothetical protein n=1 Tax=Paraburkholderia sp. TaxID=1926495 RepID=UPI002B4A7CCA|nr:hypothetical protein [Paraburkholderia sp.]HKR44537.1 hypothetical protein [Paraburkholderia sp.]